MSAPSGLDPEASKYLKQASDEFIRCRLYGHAWDPTHDGYIVEGKGSDRVYTQRLRCMRCDSKGLDEFDPVTLDRINTRDYDYAEGYLMTGHNGSLSRREVRQWVAAKSAGRRRLRRVS